MPRWSKPLALLADLLMPRACASCDRTLLEDDGPFCRACARGVLSDLSHDYCPRCGRTAEPYLTTAEGCPNCRSHRSPLENFVRVGTYRGTIGDVIRRFKFERQQQLDHTLGSLLADAIRGRPWCDELDALVPVPTNWRERWHYGFHPAGLIAHCVGASLNLPALPLVRVHRKPRRQTGLSESERILNIRGVFRLARGARVSGASLCVIDDVSTSGATLREMARVLKAAGAAHVFGAVVAKTQLDGNDTPPAVPPTTAPGL